MNLTLDERTKIFRQGLPVGGNQAFQSRDERGGLECAWFGAAEIKSSHVAIPKHSRRKSTGWSQNSRPATPDSGTLGCEIYQRVMRSMRLCIASR